MQSSRKSTEHVPQSNSGRLHACARVFPRTKARRGFREESRCMCSIDDRWMLGSVSPGFIETVAQRRSGIRIRNHEGEYAEKCRSRGRTPRVRAKHEAEELNIKRTCGHFIDTLRCYGMERAARKSRRIYACRWITRLNSPREFHRSVWYAHRVWRTFRLFPSLKFDYSRAFLLGLVGSPTELAAFQVVARIGFFRLPFANERPRFEWPWGTFKCCHFESSLTSPLFDYVRTLQQVGCSSSFDSFWVVTLI